MGSDYQWVQVHKSVETEVLREWFSIYGKYEKLMEQFIHFSPYYHLDELKASS